MDTKLEINQEVQNALIEQIQPLLGNNATPKDPKQQKTPAQKAMRKTFKGTAHLANLLPTGSVLAFQLLSPAFTHQGQCPTAMSRTITLGLLSCCALSCFLLSFTDSVRDTRGKVRYGLATFKGLCVVDGSVMILPEEAAKYRLRVIDFFHALAALLVFAAVAAFDQNVVKCFCPMPSEEVKELLVALPVGIGILCSLFFVAFPSRRHGIGFPLSRD
ncbi:hypothetical protein UlMin_020693 [Ulmus minor]